MNKEPLGLPGGFQGDKSIDIGLDTPIQAIGFDFIDMFQDVFSVQHSSFCNVKVFKIVLLKKHFAIRKFATLTALYPICLQQCPASARINHTPSCRFRHRWR